MEYLFAQIIIVSFISLIAVMVVCVLKNLVPKEQVSKFSGWSGKVANVLTAVGHSYAWFEIGMYRKTTLFSLISNMPSSSRTFMEYSWFVLLLIVAIIMNTAFYRLIKGKLGIFSKSLPN